MRATDRATGQRVERGPLVRRRDGTTRRDPERLRIELTPLAQVWLAIQIPGGSSAWAWLRARGLVGSVSAPSADLRDASLRDASLRDADLSGALRRPTDAPIPGWTVRDWRLERAS
jgi:hypothetical protein